jgi:hypothetical protein
MQIEWGRFFGTERKSNSSEKALFEIHVDYLYPGRTIYFIYRKKS